MQLPRWRLPNCERFWEICLVPCLPWSAAGPGRCRSMLSATWSAWLHCLSGLMRWASSGCWEMDTAGVGLPDLVRDARAAAHVCCADLSGTHLTAEESQYAAKLA